MKLKRRILAEPIFIIVILLLTLLMPMVLYANSKFTGADLFRDKGCIGCHSIGGLGGQVGPALDTVGDRYTAEWLYEWLHDPSAVKPGTKMPNLHLTDNERALLVFFLFQQRSGQNPPPKVTIHVGGFRSNPPDLNPQSPENDYLKLGTKESYVQEQHHTLQDQIQTFIPPLFEPAFMPSAFVLPPGALRPIVSFQYAGKIDADDVTGQREIGARFKDFDVDLSFLDFDVALGLDHNFTVDINVPFKFSRISNTELNPGFINSISVFPTGSVRSLGDIKIFLKKKFIDQGNFPIGLAGVAAISFPTGNHDERFDPRTTVRIGGTDMLLPLPTVSNDGKIIPNSANGTFRRFSNDGRLPAPLQPGLGTFGYLFGLFITRQFEGFTPFGRGAFHTGALYEIRPKDDGIDPGNLFTYFATVVKPVIGDKVSLDITYLLQHQEEDSYDGKIAVPNSLGGISIINRPPFSGGTTQFIGPSLIVVPNPLFRLVVSSLFRVDKPGLGPSPPYLFRVGLEYTFSSGLFRRGR